MNSSALRGILWMLLTTLLFVLVTAIVRFIGDGIPASQAAFIRYVIGTILLLPFILPLIKQSINKKDLIIYIFRGFAHGAGVILWFYAMSRIPIAEVTAIAFLLNYISQAPLWLTSAITLIICLLYILKGGFKLSIITDKYQFIFIILIILLSIFLILGNIELPSFELIKKNSPQLVNKDYLPNYTAGLTFFIAALPLDLFLMYC